MLTTSNLTRGSKRIPGGTRLLCREEHATVSISYDPKRGPGVRVAAVGMLLVVEPMDAMSGGWTCSEKINTALRVQQCLVRVVLPWGERAWADAGLCVDATTGAPVFPPLTEEEVLRG